MVAVVVLLAAPSLPACSADERPTFIDLARVAEVWRVSEPELSRACGQGFIRFATAADEALGDVRGARRYRETLGMLSRPGTPRPGADDLAEPAVVRLLLHRYARLCRVPDIESAGADLTRLGQAPPDDRMSDLEEALGRLVGPSVRGTRRRGAAGRVLAFDIEGSSNEPVILLACLACHPEDPNGGPPQLLATAAALSAVADSGVRLHRPVRLLVCADASGDLAGCRAGIEPSDERAAAAIALDGMQPLLVSWSGEGTWRLALPHQPEPFSRPTEPGTRRTARRGEPPVVIDVEVESSPGQLPASAAMLLASRSDTPDDLRQQVEAAVEAISRSREGASFDVEVEGDAVRVSVRRPPQPAWTIDQRADTLWDLAALARQLRVTDPRGGAHAAMLRVVQRFDGDPFGARLGLHYEDPVGGPLLVAPCSLDTTGSWVQLDLGIYRPPGIDRREFGTRLDEARRRLRAAAGRPVVEVGREVGEPSLVSPDSDLVRVARAAFEDATGEPAPAPGGAPRPGMAALLPRAIAIRLPIAPDDPALDRATALMVDLVWGLAAAPDEDVRARSSWR
jgi:hypothetical protein